MGSEDLAVAALVMRGIKQNQRVCLIDPRTNTRLQHWDIFVALVLIYTALVTPYESCFLEPTPTPSTLFWINRVVDVIFLLDMTKEFFVMFEDETGQRLNQKVEVEGRMTAKVAGKGSTMVTSHWRIAKRYLQGWFVIDFFSVATVAFDVQPYLATGADSSSSIQLNRLKFLKIMRALRLVKLVRLFKTSRIFERWQASISLDFSTQTIIKCLGLYLICGHWFACLLNLSTSFADCQLFTWKGSKGYCVRASDIGEDESAARFGILTSRPGIPPQLAHGHDWRLEPPSDIPDYAHITDIYCVSPFELWSASYYWMIMLISGASGGDTNRGDMYPSEQYIFTGLVVASALVWSQIIASFCDVLCNLNPEASAFRQRMDHLNRYCRNSKFDTDTRRRLREYLFRARQVQVEESQHELMLLMSPKLQGELSLQVCRTLLAVPASVCTCVWPSRAARTSTTHRLTRRPRPRRPLSLSRVLSLPLLAGQRHLADERAHAPEHRGQVLCRDCPRPRRRRLRPNRAPLPKLSVPPRPRYCRPSRQRARRRQSCATPPHTKDTRTPRVSQRA